MVDYLIVIKPMRGGHRAGAGRKQGFAAKSAEEARRVLAELVMAEIRPIGAALVAKAKKGDIAATRELFDRAFGRAPQALAIDYSEQIDTLRPAPNPILDEIAARMAEELYRVKTA